MREQTDFADAANSGTASFTGVPCPSISRHAEFSLLTSKAGEQSTRTSRIDFAARGYLGLWHLQFPVGNEWMHASVLSGQCRSLTFDLVSFGGRNRRYLFSTNSPTLICQIQM